MTSDKVKTILLLIGFEIQHNESAPPSWKVTRGKYEHFIYYDRSCLFRYTPSLKAPYSSYTLENIEDLILTL